MLHLVAEGPWNKEIFQSLHVDFQQAFRQIDINNYVVLVEFLGEAIMVGEVYQEHVEFIKKGNAKAIAVDLSKCTTASLSKQIFTNLYRDGGLKAGFFDNNQAARAWLSEQLDK